MSSDLSRKSQESDDEDETGNLESEDWFHGLLPREDIGLLLNQQGDFLIRQSEPTTGEGMKKILSVMWNGLARHCIINELGGRVFIERYQFSSVSDLVKFYMFLKIPISQKSGALLLAPILRQNWELKHNQIVLGSMISEGASNAVYEGTLNLPEGKINVAVKVYKGKDLHKKLIKTICREARIMRRHEHPNIIKFYGVTVRKKPIMILMELVRGGSLDSYLVKYGSGITVAEKIQMCVDAANGLEYLHNKGCIHRDVAARNCLVKNMRVKISDFGLSREITKHEEKYNIKDFKQKLPIRWLAPETLKRACYTTKSDVFSFGILLWEIFTDAEEPYSGMTIAEVNVQIKSGYRMPAPDSMPKSIGRLMKHKCFAADPFKRWTMTNIREKLCDILKSLHDEASKSLHIASLEKEHCLESAESLPIIS